MKVEKKYELTLTAPSPMNAAVCDLCIEDDNADE